MPGIFSRITAITGLGVDSRAATDTNVTELSAGRAIVVQQYPVNNVSIQDPLGLLLPGATIGNPRLEAASLSNVCRTDGFCVHQLGRRGHRRRHDVRRRHEQDREQLQRPDRRRRTASSAHCSVYVTTTGGNWPLKGIRYEVEINYELAPVPATAAELPVWRFPTSR